MAIIAGYIPINGEFFSQKSSFNMSTQTPRECEIITIKIGNPHPFHLATRNHLAGGREQPEGPR